MDHLSAAGSSATRNLTTTEPSESLNRRKTVDFRFQRPHATSRSFFFNKPMRAMDSRRDFTSKKVFSGYFSELGEKANSALVAVPGLVVFLRATPKDPATRRSAHECSAECNTSGTGCSSASVAVGGCRVRCCGGALFGIWLEDPPRILPLLTEEENGLSMTAEAS